MSKVNTTKDNNLRSSASKSEKSPSTSQVECNQNNGNANNQPIVHIGKVRYHNFLINIFTDFTEKNPHHFFFEPIVLLDLKSISSQTNHLFKQHVVHFTLKMWNTELRSKVLERVQSMPTFKGIEIDKEDICVMPYEEVQLVLQPGSIMDQSVKLMDQPMISFHSSHSSDRLHFYFICDARSTADALAENFREYPAFVLQKWKLALECRGLVLGIGAPSKSPSVTISVSTLPPQVVADNKTTVDENTKGPPKSLLTSVKDSTNLCQDLTDWMTAMIDNKKWTNATPVFSAKRCRNPDDRLTTLLLPPARKSTGERAPRPSKTKPGLLGFSIIETASNKHGTIDLLNGKFTVKLAGIYLLHFSGYYSKETSKDSGSVLMRVNSRSVARSSPRVSADPKKPTGKEDDNDEEELDSVVISSYLRLEANDVVDCYSNELYLHEERGSRQDTIKSNITTRFSAFYFSDV